MIRTMLTAVTAVALTGCSASLEPGGFGSSNRGDQHTQLAAFAAASDNQFPQDAEASEDLKAFALINRDDNTIRIFNLSDSSLTNAKLWVNKTYVRQLPAIAAGGSERVSFNELYSNAGRTLAANEVPVQNIQILTGDSLYNLLGPAYE